MSCLLDEIGISALVNMEQHKQVCVDSAQQAIEGYIPEVVTSRLGPLQLRVGARDSSALVSANMCRYFTLCCTCGNYEGSTVSSGSGYNAGSSTSGTSGGTW